MKYNWTMSIQYYEDLTPNMKYKSREYILTEKEIIDFAKEWTPRLVHIDLKTAEKTQFGGVIAAATHLVCICMKLSVETLAEHAGIAGIAWQETRFLNPARPDDRLILEIELIPLRESRSNPSAGILQYEYKLWNQKGQLVLQLQAIGTVQKRPLGIG